VDTRPLWVYAAPIEGDGLAEALSACADLACIGVGKSAATMNLTLAITRRQPSWVLGFGLCGAYPAGHGPGSDALEVGDLCVLARDVLADEGVKDPSGFRDLAAMGLGDCGPFEADPARTERVARALGGLPIVQGATVSTCSGTDALSSSVGQRTRAHVETMEGAAIGMVCRALGVPWTQLRCVSNRTGNRATSGWDLEGTLARLHAAMRRLPAGGLAPR
jgi:futalosine hydrolase